MKSFAKVVLGLVLGLYVLSAAIASLYYNWQYARDQGFLSWLLLGEIVSTAKGVTWPYWVMRTSAENTRAEQVAKIAEEGYFGILDKWVTDGGRFDDVQARVVDTCGKLTVLWMDEAQRGALMREDKTMTEEFHFRVDVCTKMTVNRVHQQPEFQKAGLVSATCGRSGPKYFRRLCDRSGLPIK
jgi:hypothetical protein